MRKKRKQHQILSRLEHFQLFALDQDTSNPTIKMRISCLPILGGVHRMKKIRWQPAFLGGKFRSIRNAPGVFLQRKKTRFEMISQHNSASLRVHVRWPCREKKVSKVPQGCLGFFSACAICAAMSVISLDVLPSDFSLPPSIHRNPSLKRCHILVKARPMAAENSKVTESKKKRRNGPGLRRKEPKQLEPPITWPYVFSTNHPGGKWAHLTYEATNLNPTKNHKSPGTSKANHLRSMNLYKISKLWAAMNCKSQLESCHKTHFEKFNITWLRNWSSHLSHLGPSVILEKTVKRQDFPSFIRRLQKALCTKLLTNKRYSFSDHSHLWDPAILLFVTFYHGTPRNF